MLKIWQKKPKDIVLTEQTDLIQKQIVATVMYVRVENKLQTYKWGGDVKRKSSSEQQEESSARYILILNIVT